ncbi:MAG: large conductance mechanosensitive channel protein MscL [Muribaculaceae bacterium]|nr:large conductance mechanosensitive channel protein MscL [Muribaculaceae bacterium]MBR1551307.1 large conductance mechanosensitive channel protein MscL [Muribaculaceae bacterium]HAP50592.1 large conductance mechanosensitive channel protein MscL [Porphyromonadaceae bacterium]
MGFVKEFKEFAMKGNVMDMAVGVIIGGAFGKIVSSLVEDIIMPLVSLATGGTDFSNLFVRFGEIPEGVANNYAALKEAGVSMFAYGAFIQNIIDFLIIALCIFLMIKAMNKLSKKKAEEPAPEPEPSAEEKLLGEIRDLLKEKK